MLTGEKNVLVRLLYINKLSAPGKKFEALRKTFLCLREMVL